MIGTLTLEQHPILVMIEMPILNSTQFRQPLYVASAHQQVLETYLWNSGSLAKP